MPNIYRLLNEDKTQRDTSIDLKKTQKKLESQHLTKITKKTFLLFVQNYILKYALYIIFQII